MSNLGLGRMNYEDFNPKGVAISQLRITGNPQEGNNPPLLNSSSSSITQLFSFWLFVPSGGLANNTAIFQANQRVWKGSNPSYRFDYPIAIDVNNNKIAASIGRYDNETPASRQVSIVQMLSSGTLVHNAWNFVMVQFALSQPLANIRVNDTIGLQSFYDGNGFNNNAENQLYSIPNQFIYIYGQQGLAELVWTDVAFGVGSGNIGIFLKQNGRPANVLLSGAVGQNGIINTGSTLYLSARSNPSDISADRAKANQFGITGTPTFIPQKIQLP